MQQLWNRAGVILTTYLLLVNAKAMPARNRIDLSAKPWVDLLPVLTEQYHGLYQGILYHCWILLSVVNDCFSTSCILPLHDVTSLVIYSEQLGSAGGVTINRTGPHQTHNGPHPVRNNWLFRFDNEFKGVRRANYLVSVNTTSAPSATSLCWLPPPPPPLRAFTVCSETLVIKIKFQTWCGCVLL